MSDSSPIQRILAELKRRRVFHTAAAYGAAAYVAIEASDLVLPRLGFPDRAVTLVVWLALIGFPFALGAAWLLERREGGLAVTEPARPGELEAIASEPRMRRWPSGALAVAGTIMLVTGAWLTLRSRTAADAPTVSSESSVVVVLPFAVTGGSASDYLGSGLVDLLATRMDGIGSIRTAPARAVMGLVSQETGDPLSPRTADRIATTLGASRYVAGRVLESGGQISIHASLNAVGSIEPVTEATVEGSDQELFDLVDQLTTRLVAGMESSPDQRVRQLAALTTTSLPALKAYLTGEELLRAGQFTPALASFEQATALDSTFALAHFRTSIAREWGSQAGASEAAEAAWRHSQRLSERDRLLVEAMWSWRRGDGARAEDLYRAILGTWPDDVESWFQLAEVLNHFGPMRGGSVSASREPFERVLRFEPEHLLSLWHVVRIDAVEGDLAAMAERMDQIIALSPEGDRTLELVAMESALTRPEAWPAIVDSLMVAQDITRYFALWNVAVFTEDLDRARELIPAMTEPSRSTEVRATGHLQDALLALARGRPSETASLLGEVARIDPELATAHRAAIALMPFFDTDLDAIAAHRDAVDTWAPEGGCLSDHPVRSYEPATCVRPVVRAYLLGLLEARLGRPDPARRRVEAIRGFMEADEDQGHGEEFQAAVLAEIAIQQGDTVPALVALEGTPRHVSYVHALQSIFYSHSYARFRRAQALAAAGRLDEAIQWYSSFDEMALYDLAFVGPAMKNAGVLLEAAGRTDEARPYYEKALRFLDGGEGVFGEWAAEAREALERRSGD